MDNLRKSLATARANGVEVRGIAVINPGNPTGNILAEEQIKDIIQARYRKHLLTKPYYSAYNWRVVLLKGRSNAAVKSIE